MGYDSMDTRSLNNHIECVHSTEDKKIQCIADAVTTWVNAGAAGALHGRLHRGDRISCDERVIESSIGQRAALAEKP